MKTNCNSSTEIEACSPCGIPVSNSVTKFSPSQLNVFPNPAKDILHFEYESPENELMHFTIENNLGQQIAKGQTSTNRLKAVEISDYPDGIYQLNVHHGGQFTSKMFHVSK